MTPDMNDVPPVAPRERLAHGERAARDKLWHSDRSDYYSVRFAPARKRGALAALYAFWHEVREILVECSDAQVAHVKLAWWYDEIHAMYAKQPRHPISVPLAQAVADHELPQRPFLTLIEGLNRQAGPAHYDSFEMLAEHYRQTRGQLTLLAGAIGGDVDAALAEPLVDAGMLQALTSMLRDIGADVRRGQLSLPQEDLARFGVRLEDIYGGRESEAFRALMEFEITRALEAIRQHRERLARQTHLAPLRIGMELCRALLEEIRADGYRVLSRRLELTPLRQLWIAYRAS
jgi:15-cis-phytoene synthase